MAWSHRIELTGAGGEPVDFLRTLRSHGVADLPPMFASESPARLETTLRVNGGARAVVVQPAGRRAVLITARGRVGVATGRAIVEGIRHVLRLDADLSTFYEMCERDPELAWVSAGAGRMMRSATAFEDVVKTICTTNCSWSATERMVGALIEHLGERAPGAPRTGVRGRAFPTPEAMAEADEDFYRGVVRAGYRGAYLKSLARSVASGEVDVEAFAADEVSDEELEMRLLALPGVGPYAAAHVMMMMGRYSRLILDSWTRPTYARLAGYKKVKDSTIARRWRRYGDYAGLAFWLYLTRGWVEEELEPELV
jgi:3-methyladenine DNA glycosylase/8-oxoguanine DNA glycosylase